MPSITYAAVDEAAFLADLLLDDSLHNHYKSQILLPTQHPTQRGKPLAPFSSKVFSAVDADMTVLLEGAEDWDWGDTANDLTPKKSPTKKKVSIGPWNILPAVV
ncbi:hypothetical protein DXG01_010642 [Tephrocybe rancida]|nr:hypothetical protein DXG01_010642 [Tephrocybe rancida]